MVSLLQVYRHLSSTEQSYNLIFLASCEEEVSGKITKIAQAVLNGNSHYYLMLENSDAIYDVSVADIIDVIRCELGEQVTVGTCGTERRRQCHL